MVKMLNQKESLYFSRFYPFKSPCRSQKKYQATLGIGGNMGDVKRRFNHLFWYLQRSPFIDVLQTSPVLKNPPFGYLEQDDFHNALIIVKTCLQPKALLRYILNIEKRFSRKRSFPDAPRTLDIDMIFYENVQMKSRKLTLPHPSWDKRDSVLIPLSYLHLQRIC